MSDSVMEVVHETATGLYQAGLMSKSTMRELDQLCLPEIEKYNAQQIKTIRLQNKASQGVFASYLNVSKSTIQQWEQGLKKPNGPSLKLLNLVAKQGLQILA